MTKLLTFFSILLLTALPAKADEIEEILTGALEAYQEGDAKLAKEEVEYVLELLKGVEGEALAGLLPEPLDGWSKEISDDAMGLAMMGGSGASANYKHEDGSYFSVTMTNAPQLIGTMGAMLGNTAMLASMGKIIRIEREKFVLSDRQLQGVVGGTFYVNFEGNDPEAMQTHLESMDIKALKDF